MTRARPQYQWRNIPAPEARQAIKKLEGVWLFLHGYGAFYKNGESVLAARRFSSVGHARRTLVFGFFLFFTLFQRCTPDMLPALAPGAPKSNNLLILFIIYWVQVRVHVGCSGCKLGASEGVAKKHLHPFKMLICLGFNVPTGLLGCRYFFNLHPAVIHGWHGLRANWVLRVQVVERWGWCFGVACE